MKFRDLKADEIEVRVGTCSEKGCSLLLYKTARTDADILDETVGSENWECDYGVLKGNLFCYVSILKDGERITKCDCGTESNMEAQKGEASDAFKRACFKWGIGRELYSAPFIWVSSDNCNIKSNRQGKPSCFDKFSVKDIEIQDKKIISLTIHNESKGRDVFSTKQHQIEPKTTKQKTATNAHEINYDNLKNALNAYADAFGIDRNQAKRDIWSRIPKNHTQKQIDELAAELTEKAFVKGAENG